MLDLLATDLALCFQPVAAILGPPEAVPKGRAQALFGDVLAKLGAAAAPQCTSKRAFPFFFLQLSPRRLEAESRAVAGFFFLLFVVIETLFSFKSLIAVISAQYETFGLEPAALRREPNILRPHPLTPSLDPRPSADL